MGRILILLFIGVFVASVVLWAEDNLLEEKYLGEVVERDPEFEESVVLEGVDEVDMSMQVDGEYEYGVFKGESELRVYSDLESSDIEELIDQGYVLFVMLDGSDLDQTRYNFDDFRYVQVNDYDGEYFYTSKYGMKVGGGYMFTKKDFIFSFRVSGGAVVAFNL
jgi:hypothetical protein